MKKKWLLVIGALIVIIIIVLLILLMNKPKYTIKVSSVDDRSPDRILTVYKNNEEIEFKRIELMDGTILCNSVNKSVYFGNIKDVKELKVILKDKSEVIAQIVKEEVAKL